MYLIVSKGAVTRTVHSDSIIGKLRAVFQLIIRRTSALHCSLFHTQDTHTQVHTHIKTHTYKYTHPQIYTPTHTPFPYKCCLFYPGMSLPLQTFTWLIYNDASELSLGIFSAFPGPQSGLILVLMHPVHDFIMVLTLYKVIGNII